MGIFLKNRGKIRIIWGGDLGLLSAPKIQEMRALKHLQIQFHGIAQINGKYIKQVGYSIVNGKAPWRYNVKTLARKNPHLPSSR